MKKILSILLTLILICSCAVPVFAAESPYGYTYRDSSTGRMIYKYYEYNTTKGTYVPVMEFQSAGSYLYKASSYIANNMSTSQAITAGYDVKGNFYIICTDGTVQKWTRGSSSLSPLEIKDAVQFVCNADDLITKVTTSSGTLAISNLQPEDTEPTITPVSPAKNRVDITTNALGEQVSKAYKDGKIVLTIVVSKDEQKVLNNTNHIRLTDTLKGAKFIGIDTQYRVYLYEGNSLYRFSSKNWYSPERLTLSGTYKKYQLDGNGFISKVVTTTGTYSISQLSSTNKWVAKKTYAVNKVGYSTMYKKGSTKSYTLKLTSGKIYLNGKKISSKAIKKFGFISAKKFAVIDSKGICYTSSISKPSLKVKVKKAKSFKFSASNGLLTAVILNNGKSITLK